MSRQKSKVELLADVWGKLVPCRWQRRTLVCICGPVSAAVPLLVRWSGSRKKALRARDRLRRCGFDRVTVRKKRGGQMIRVSEGQALILVRLACGWRLEYLAMVNSCWIDPEGVHRGGEDMRPVHGLWKRHLIELGAAEPNPAGRDVRYFSLTQAGRDLIAESQGEKP